MKVLIFDIETAPLLAHVWSAKTDYIGAHMFVHDSFLLSWAAKWEDGKRVVGDRLNATEAREQLDGRIVESLANKLREADVVVAHNADRFDLPMLNNRLLLLGLEPLGSIKTIDTLTLARRSFRLASNKLDYLAQQLLGDQKIPTDFDLWRRAYLGQETALRQMYTYNRKDVTLLERVYQALKPYVKGLPRLIDAEREDERRCPHCGSDSLVKDGVYRTNASTFQKWRCSEQDCRRNSRSRQADKTRKLSVVPVQ